MNKQKGEKPAKHKGGRDNTKYHETFPDVHVNFQDAVKMLVSTPKKKTKKND